MSKKIIGQRGEALEIVNARTTEAIVALKALQSWVNDPVQDKRTADNISNWLFKLLMKIEIIAFELKNYQ